MRFANERSYITHAFIKITKETDLVHDPIVNTCLRILLALTLYYNFTLQLSLQLTS